MALNMTLYNIFASPLMYVIISDIDVSVQSTISTTVTATSLEKSRTKRFQCRTHLLGLLPRGDHIRVEEILPF